MERIQRGGRPVAGFGVGFSETGLYVSDDDLATSKVQWAARMKKLSDAYTAFTPTWTALDPKAFADWTSDWKALQQRYQAALQNEGMFTLNSTTWLAMQRAMQQCYPPSSCPTSKGDWADLFDRLTTATKAVGAPPPQDVPAHLIPQTFGEKAYAATDPSNIHDPFEGLLKWFKDHKTALIVGGSVVGGVVVLWVLSPYARLLSAAVPSRR
jgi:hypothetical protein